MASNINRKGSAQEVLSTCTCNAPHFVPIDESVIGREQTPPF